MKRTDWLSAFVICLLVVAALVLPAYALIRVNEVQLEVTCVSAKANVSQLGALTEIADQLGIPHNFTVPEVPDECDS